MLIKKFKKQISTDETFKWQLLFFFTCHCFRFNQHIKKEYYGAKFTNIARVKAFKGSNEYSQSTNH